MYPNLSDYDVMYHNIIKKDILSLINGLVDSFTGIVLTKPSILRKTENKVFQLVYAKQNNILIPESFIGNDNLELSKLKSDNRVIKPISIGKIYTKNKCELYQTQRFNSFYEDISYTPIYIQNYINKLFEVRITVIHKSIFAVRIDAGNKLDWRKSYDTNKYSIIDIPKHVENDIFNMMKSFELKFGTFDYIVDKYRNWIFLEINPNGQWLWLESILNLNISDAIVDYLIKGEK